MSLVDGMKEVYFGQFCKKCTHFENMDDEEPCCECLDEPFNQYSHKPVKFEDKDA